MSDTNTVAVRVRIDVPFGVVEIPESSLDDYHDLYADSVNTTWERLKEMSDAEVAKFVRDNFNVCEITNEDKTETLYQTEYFD